MPQFDVERLPARDPRLFHRRCRYLGREPELARRDVQGVDRLNVQHVLYRLRRAVLAIQAQRATPRCRVAKAGDRLAFSASNIDNLKHEKLARVSRHTNGKPSAYI